MNDAGHGARLKPCEGAVEKSEGIRLNLGRVVVMADADRRVLTLPAEPVAQSDVVMAPEADDDNAGSDDDGEDEDGEE